MAVLKVKSKRSEADGAVNVLQALVLFGCGGSLWQGSA